MFGMLVKRCRFADQALTVPGNFWTVGIQNWR